MSLGDNGAAGYQLSYSAAVVQKLRRLRAGLSDPDEVRKFTAALQIIITRLRSDPLVFGEHRHPLPNLQVTVRAAVVGRLFVRYAVHNHLPLVFALNFKLLGGGEP